MSEKSLFAKFREKVRAGKIVEIVVVLILAVVVIAIVYSIIAGDPGGAAASDSETYAQSVERELSSVLSKLDGAGEVDVFVSVANRRRDRDRDGNKSRCGREHDDDARSGWRRGGRA